MRLLLVVLFLVVPWGVSASFVEPEMEPYCLEKGIPLLSYEDFRDDIRLAYGKDDSDLKGEWLVVAMCPGTKMARIHYSSRSDVEDMRTRIVEMIASEEVHTFEKLTSFTNSRLVLTADQSPGSCVCDDHGKDG